MNKKIRVARLSIFSNTLLILKESFELFSKAYAPLLDRALPPAEVEPIFAIIRQQ